jgi:hypothetical protein
MSNDAARRRLFPDEFDATFPVGAEPGNIAFFGRDVLQGLVNGIDEFIHRPQQRWDRYRSLGPPLLGSALWIDDLELIHKIGELASACIVVSNQGRKLREIEKLGPLAKVNEHTPGMPIAAFSALTGLAPKENGKPPVLGPYSRMYDNRFPRFVRWVSVKWIVVGTTVRRSFAPSWYFSVTSGGTMKTKPATSTTSLASQAMRLWVSSANFTASSRRNLEFGYWTEDLALVDGAERFLVKLMGSSEALDPESDHFNPGRGPGEYDELPCGRHRRRSA